MMAWSAEMIAEQAAWVDSLSARYGDDVPDLMSRYEQTCPEGQIDPPDYTAAWAAGRPERAEKKETDQ